MQEFGRLIRNRDLVILASYMTSRYGITGWRYFPAFAMDQSRPQSHAIEWLVGGVNAGGQFREVQV